MLFINKVLLDLYQITKQKNRIMKAVKTFVLVFKSGRRDKFFAIKKIDLKEMCNWTLVEKCIEIK